MKKEGEVRAEDDGKALGEVPVPGMGAVEICHAVEDVKLQEVELNQGPLKKTKQKQPSLLYPTSHLRTVRKFYLFIENAVDHS